MGQELTKEQISKILSNSGLFVLPKAAKKIEKYEYSKDLTEKIVKTKDGGETIDENIVESVISNLDSNSTDEEKPSEKENFNGSSSNLVCGETIDPKDALDDFVNRRQDSGDVDKLINRKETLSDRYPEWCDIMFNRELQDSKPRVDVVEDEFEIRGDITGRSRGTGDFKDFQKLFQDRYEKMTTLVNNRVGGTKRISDIHARHHGGESITVVGLVWDTFVSKNGNYFIDLEDPKTNDLMRIGWTDDWIKESFEQVVPDEVIAIRGNLSDDGDIIWGDDEVRRGRPPIMFPDIPRNKSRNKANKEVKAAMISDVHVGADEFYPAYWNNFVDWIRQEPKVKYIFIGGDLVEGIGVYPDQDEELHILDIHDQYAMMGRMLDQIPSDVRIFAGVGNHDTVRLGEPQPTHPEKFQKYFPENVEFVGNPVTIEVQGVNFLMYHGMSINALAEAIPGLDPEDPIPIMELLLKKRHVAPVYGKNVRLAPEEQDNLVINEVPDVLHCGHVHQYDHSTYNGVKLANTATWQGQTSFQKSKGINPDVGYWSTINLSTLDITKHKVDS